MSRINAGIKPKNLTDEHLLAEHREIKRICNLFRSRIDNGKSFNDIPSKFTLGKGHMLFFLDKGYFTLQRYRVLYNECKRRGFNVTDYSTNWGCYSFHDQQFFNGYIPTKAAKDEVTARIIDNIRKGSLSTYHWYGKKITKREAISLLTK